MVETAHSWLCPACGRRVPQRIQRCHCGLLRSQADAVAPPGAERRPPPPSARRRGPGLLEELAATMPREVRLLVAAGLLVTLAGFGWLVFGPRTPDRTPRILGYVDAGPPPAARPTPPPQPPFKLPWWR